MRLRYIMWYANVIVRDKLNGVPERLRAAGTRRRTLPCARAEHRLCHLWGETPHNLTTQKIPFDFDGTLISY